MSIAVSIQNAHKTYPNEFTAIHDVSFDIQEGEFFGLLGPNGAGKTTLISAMAGLNQLTSGHIYIAGHHVEKQVYAARMSLGVVPQELVFDPFFTVREALQFQSGYFGIKKNDAWIEEILFNLGLSNQAETNSRNLSGGMKRRLMIAQALVHKPPVIVLDEPTAGVDIELRQNLWLFIEKLNHQGHTIILTTHYLEEAQSLCSRIAMMKHGRVIALDSTQNFLNINANSIVNITLSHEIPPSLLQYVVEKSHFNYVLTLSHFDLLAQILEEIKQHNIHILNLNINPISLGEVFLQIMHTGEYV